MLIRKSSDIASSEITPKDFYVNRRKFLAGASAVGAAALIGGYELLHGTETAYAGTPIAGIQKSNLSTTEKQTPYKDVTTYNNFYEFGTDKADPSANAKNFRTRPWTVTIDGLVKKPKTLDIDAIMKLAAPEERVYRHRCVERWSIVVPWIGYSMSTLLKQVEPLGKAKYVQFTTLNDSKQMPGQSYRVLDWPYTEGLRLDEAMHPLAMLTFGLYGELLPNQNGAPLRMTVPWKYGFKSGKSIVRVTFTENQPATAWNKSGPNEYGFYSNVNPNVDHPRWSQGTERRLGEFSQRKTLMFNGYDQVAGLYSGMDLKKYF